MKITLVEKGIKSSIDYHRYHHAKYEENGSRDFNDDHQKHLPH